MATQSAVFTFALPEDKDADQLLIYSASTKEGTYSLAATVAYEYGETTYEYDSLDDVTWYKVCFNNSSDSEQGPLSDPVYGGDFSNAKPFLALSTGSDGANYATSQDVYDYSTLTTQDVTSSRVSTALRQARAIIDLEAAEHNLDRLTKTFDADISRKKYNAILRILKEAEINLAIGNVYRGLADDLIIQKNRNAVLGSGANLESVSIGKQKVTFTDEETHGSLMKLADRYEVKGHGLLLLLQPMDVRIHFKGERVRSPRFKLPFNGY